MFNLVEVGSIIWFSIRLLDFNRTIIHFNYSFLFDLFWGLHRMFWLIMFNLVEVSSIIWFSIRLFDFTRNIMILEVLKIYNPIENSRLRSDIYSMFLIIFTKYILMN